MIKGFLSSSTGLCEDGGGLVKKTKTTCASYVKMYRYNKNQVKKNTKSREPRHFERNCFNFSNKNTLNAGNCVIIAKLISSFLKGCIFGHFGHDYSKSGETESYLTISAILIALLFQRVQLYNEYAA